MHIVCFIIISLAVAYFIASIIFSPVGPMTPTGQPHVEYKTSPDDELDTYGHVKIIVDNKTYYGRHWCDGTISWYYDDDELVTFEPLKTYLSRTAIPHSPEHTSFKTSRFAKYFDKE